MRWTVVLSTTNPLQMKANLYFFYLEITVAESEGRIEAQNTSCLRYNVTFPVSDDMRSHFIWCWSTKLF